MFTFHIKINALVQGRSCHRIAVGQRSNKNQPCGAATTVDAISMSILVIAHT